MQNLPDTSGQASSPTTIVAVVTAILSCFTAALESTDSLPEGIREPLIWSMIVLAFFSLAVFGTRSMREGLSRWLSGGLIVLFAIVAIGAYTIFNFHSRDPHTPTFRIIDSNIEIDILANGESTLKRTQVLEVLAPNVSLIAESDLFATGPRLEKRIIWDIVKLNSQSPQDEDESSLVKVSDDGVDMNQPYQGKIVTQFDSELIPSAFYRRTMTVHFPNAYEPSRKGDWFKLNIVHPTKAVVVKIATHSPRLFNPSTFIYIQTKSKGQSISSAPIKQANNVTDGKIYRWSSDSLSVGDQFLFQWDWQTSNSGTGP